MNHFTEEQYIQLAIANTYGLDKLTYAERLAKVGECTDSKQASEPHQHKAHMHAYEQWQQGNKYHQPVYFDAICSGMQILGVLSGCEKACMATGLINTGVRPDAYTAITKAMNIDIERDDVKKAVMTALYGSTEKPQEILGDKVSYLWAAIYEVAPTVADLMEHILGSAAKNIKYEWTLPDGHTAKTHDFKYEDIPFSCNGTELYVTKKDKQSSRRLSLLANLTHSVDGWVLRELITATKLGKTEALVKVSAAKDKVGSLDSLSKKIRDQVIRMGNQYKATGIASYTALLLPTEALAALGNAYLDALATRIDTWLHEVPYGMITIHDSFGCLPKNMNATRKLYNEIMYTITTHDLLNNLLNQVGLKAFSYRKVIPDVERILDADYAIN